MRERTFHIAAATLIAAHVSAAALAPGALWGLSSTAVFSRTLTIVAGIVAVALVLGARRLVRFERVPFPGRRAAVLYALAAGVLFWLLRERTHFLGDGALVIRELGFAGTSERAPLLGALCTAFVRALHDAGVPPATSLAALSALSGAVAVYLMLRVCRILGPDDRSRAWLCLLLVTAGSMQLFFGHVEYYAPLATLVVGHLSLTCASLLSGTRASLGLLSYPILVAMHLSALALLPAQIFLAWRTWRAQQRGAVLIAAAWTAVAAVAGAWMTRDADSGMQLFALAQRSFAPYVHAGSARHAFSLFDAQHVLAVCNDLLLNAPLAVVLLPFVLRGRTAHARVRAHDATGAAGRADVSAYLGWAAAGYVAFSFVFHRDLGAYRDWDVLAPYAFVLLLAVGVRAVLRGRPAAGDLVVVLVAGVFHTLPWVLLNAQPEKTLAHLQRVMAYEPQWSPHARGYLHEEVGIYHRTRGDVALSLAAYRRAVEANPADARYRVGLANRYVDRGEFDKAVPHFEVAVQKRPDLVGAHIGLAQSLLRTGGDPARAKEHADAAVRAEPQNATAWYVQGVASMALRDADGAREALEHALRLDPSLDAARRLLERLERGAR